MNKSLPAGPSGVDQSKVVQALEELLEGPLISGFVSKDQVSKHLLKQWIYYTLRHEKDNEHTNMNKLFTFISVIIRSMSSKF